MPLVNRANVIPPRWLRVAALPTVSSFRYLPETDSTMERAREETRHPGEGLHVIVADRQTAGRGQRGNSFYSEAEGGLWCTIIAAIGDLDRHFEYNRALSLALVDAVSEACGYCGLAVKWPNDIYWGDRKLCGMLLEVLPMTPSCLALGVGLNVNLSADDFPPHLRPIATSMRMQTGRRYDIPAVLTAIVEAFSLLRRRPQPPLHERYVHLLHGLGRRVAVGNREGVLETVLPDGRAAIRTALGSEYFSCGPLSFLERGSPVPART